jgi:hypothetical protein
MDCKDMKEFTPGLKRGGPKRKKKNKKRNPGMECEKKTNCFIKTFPHLLNRNRHGIVAFICGQFNSSSIVCRQSSIVSSKFGTIISRTKCRTTWHSAHSSDTSEQQPLRNT